MAPVHVMLLKSSTWVSRIGPARLLDNKSWMLSIKVVDNGLPEGTVDMEGCYRIAGSRLIKNWLREQRFTVWNQRINN